jgi:NAD(P)-dependent dehydrogenase (short-subunit alcohol dehydrogenase family)
LQIGTSACNARRYIGGKAIAIQADAADAEAINGAVEKTVAAFGGLDVPVNNAGTAIPKTFEETTLGEMDRMFEINVRMRSPRWWRSSPVRSPGEVFVWSPSTIATEGPLPDNPPSTPYKAFHHRGHRRAFC